MCMYFVYLFDIDGENTFLLSQRQLRYIEWMGVKIYDFQKITISTLSKLYNAGLGVLISKRYHMWG